MPCPPRDAESSPRCFLQGGSSATAHRGVCIAQELVADLATEAAARANSPREGKASLVEEVFELGSIIGSTFAVISLACCHKLSDLEQMYSLPVLEDRSPKSKCCPGSTPFESPREESCLVGTSRRLHSLTSVLWVRAPQGNPG